MLPAASTAMPTGVFNCAFTAGPPSPENPGRELPATSVRVTPLSLNTEWPLLKYTLPAPSTATRRGWPMEVPVAATGVGGGAPPATVVIEYCCPSATEAPASHRKIADLCMYTLSLTGWVRAVEAKALHL